ncbi:MAG: hypothetical protein ACLQIB_26950 [Isosphaeraceae bacterium]
MPKTIAIESGKIHTWSKTPDRPRRLQTKKAMAAIAAMSKYSVTISCCWRRVPSRSAPIGTWTR